MAMDEIVDRLVDEFVIEWGAFILHGSDCTYYRERNGEYIIFNEPVMVIHDDRIREYLKSDTDEEIDSATVLDVIYEFVRRFDGAGVYCNDDEALHFTFEGTLFHVCISDPREIAIYVEKWF